MKDSNLNKGFKGIYAKRVLHKIRLWDVLSANRVDHFIANSKYIAKRIKKIYNRESIVIYPPVDTDKFTLKEDKDTFYLAASRMVSYKKMKLIVETFNKMPNKRLVVVGDGPDYAAIKRSAKDNVELKGFLSSEDLKTYLQNAKALVFAA